MSIEIKCLNFAPKISRLVFHRIVDQGEFRGEVVKKNLRPLAKAVPAEILTKPLSCKAFSKRWGNLCHEKPVFFARSADLQAVKALLAQPTVGKVSLLATQRTPADKPQFQAKRVARRPKETGDDRSSDEIL